MKFILGVTLVAVVDCIFKLKTLDWEKVVAGCIFGLCFAATIQWEREKFSEFSVKRPTC